MHLSTAVVPRRLRRRFFDKPVAKWLVPECLCLAFPLAVKRNRFLVPLCVFCFGMTVHQAGFLQRDETPNSSLFWLDEKGVSAGSG